jgi:hypothetical protein
MTYDYDPFHFPAALVAASQVIVRGAVLGGKAGTCIHSVLILDTDTVVKDGTPRRSN